MQPVKTIARTPRAHFYKDGPRHYIEAGAGKAYRKKHIAAPKVYDILHTANALGWKQTDLEMWLNSNYETYLN